MEGYIALHRKITDNEIYFSERFTRTQAWIDLLLLATHSEKTTFIRGIEVKLNAGELCYSQESLAHRWKWNFKTVKKFLNYLKKREMVDTKTNNLTTFITIKNWQIYQVLRNKTVKESLNYGEQNGEQMESKMETNNNDNKVNKNNTTKIKGKPQAIRSKKNKSVIYSVVYLYTQIENRSIESSDYAFISTLLKLKQSDDLSYNQKCLMLCYVIKSLTKRIYEKQYKGILYNSFRDFSYSDFKKNLYNESNSIISNEYQTFN